MCCFVEIRLLHQLTASSALVFKRSVLQRVDAARPDDLDAPRAKPYPKPGAPAHRLATRTGFAAPLQAPTAGVPPANPRTRPWPLVPQGRTAETPASRTQATEPAAASRSTGPSDYTGQSRSELERLLAQTLEGIAREFQRVRRYLGLYDQILRLDVASGRLARDAADALLRTKARALFAGSFTDVDLRSLLDSHQRAVARYFRVVEKSLRISTEWPDKTAAEAYRALALSLLEGLRREYAESMRQGADPLSTLVDAAELREWSKGRRSLPTEDNVFAGARARVTEAVPDFDLKASLIKHEPAEVMFDDPRPKPMPEPDFAVAASSAGGSSDRRRVLPISRPGSSTLGSPPGSGAISRVPDSTAGTSTGIALPPGTAARRRPVDPPIVSTPREAPSAPPADFRPVTSPPMMPESPRPGSVTDNASEPHAAPRPARTLSAPRQPQRPAPVLEMSDSEQSQPRLPTSKSEKAVVRRPLAKPMKSSDKKGIRVAVGTYGGNCGAIRGNVTWPLALACDGKDVCVYTIDYAVLGDPAQGCAEDFTVGWRCSGRPRVFEARIPPEAGNGALVELSCKQ